MSNEEVWVAPAEKKAARSATRKTLREREEGITEALRADWEGRDPDSC